MCTLTGALEPKESFNLFNVDPVFLPGFEDEYLVTKNDPRNKSVRINEICGIENPFEEYERFFENNVPDVDEIDVNIDVDVPPIQESDLFSVNVREDYFSLFYQDEMNTLPDDEDYLPLRIAKRKKRKKALSSTRSVREYALVKQAHLNQKYISKTHCTFDSYGNVLRRTEIFEKKENKFLEKKNVSIRRARKCNNRDRFAFAA